MLAQTVEFAPTPAHPWTPLVSQVVGKNLLQLPPRILWDAATMREFLRPNEYTYHGMVSDRQLIAFGALETPLKPPTSESDLHMNLVYLGTASRTGAEDIAAEMLRRIEGAATYVGATMLHVHGPAKENVNFYRGQGYVWQPPGPLTGALQKPL